LYISSLPLERHQPRANVLAAANRGLSLGSQHLNGLPNRNPLEIDQKIGTCPPDCRVLKRRICALVARASASRLRRVK